MQIFQRNIVDSFAHLRIYFFQTGVDTFPDSVDGRRVVHFDVHCETVETPAFPQVGVPRRINRGIDDVFHRAVGRKILVYAAHDDAVVTRQCLAHHVYRAEVAARETFRYDARLHVFHAVDSSGHHLETEHFREAWRHHQELVLHGLVFYVEGIGHTHIVGVGIVLDVGRASGYEFHHWRAHRREIAVFVSHIVSHEHFVVILDTLVVGAVVIYLHHNHQKCGESQRKPGDVDCHRHLVLAHKRVKTFKN